MACDGNCESCPIQCGLSTLEKLKDAKKEKKEMSEGAITCKSGNEEKIAVLLAENENLKEQLKTHGASTPLSTGLKTITYVSLAIALIALCAAFYAISKADRYAEMIVTANKNSSDAISLSKDANRKALEAKERSEKNFVYLRDMKRDFKKNL